MDQWAEILEKRWRLIARYKAWRKEMRRKRIKFSTAEAVILNRESCRSVSKRSRVRNGAVGALIRQSLDLYAKCAGYLPQTKGA